MKKRLIIIWEKTKPLNGVYKITDGLYCFSSYNSQGKFSYSKTSALHILCYKINFHFTHHLEYQCCLYVYKTPLFDHRYQIKQKLVIKKPPAGIRPQFGLLEKKYPRDCAHRNGYGAL